jgi:hypothetical protein
MGFNRVSTNKPCDKHFCFFIQDFREGDSVYVMVNRQRVRGRVVAVNKRENVVLWEDGDGVISRSVLDEFSFLGPFDSEWV